VEDGLQIHQVSDLLGVPAPDAALVGAAVRMPTTDRSSGGHRRYSEEALVQLRLMR
jgi:hypothetical protein